MIGPPASLTCFAARMLGYNTRFLDGLWHDWRNRHLPWVTGPTRR